MVGYALTAFVALFLTFDTVLKVLKLAPAVQGTTELGYPAGTVLWIGLIELVCLALYLVPRTSVLGALLLTGYLGGAIATHVRVGQSARESHALSDLRRPHAVGRAVSAREPFEPATAVPKLK